MGKSKTTDWRSGTAVRIRMYRHGLGDCFLLTFPRTGPHDYQVLIDCGLILGTPNGAALIGQVADDLKRETDSRLDVLVATHEHWDHLSGFVDAHATFAEFDIGTVWMAWTEDPHDETAKELRKDRAEKVAALRLGVLHLRNELAATEALGADDAGAAASDFRRVAEVLSFFGISPDEVAGEFGAAEDSEGRTVTKAMDWCRKRPVGRRKFWTPGEVADLTEDVEGLRAFVLGPPTDRKQLFKDQPTKKGRETYEDDKHSLATAAQAFFGADLGQHDPDRSRGDFERGAPFDRKYRIPMDKAVNIDFFRTHYFGTGTGAADAWRRIDGVGLSRAAAFALKLDSDTNNTSLALAFELADGRVLLFPGDAQVGNWESWHVDGQGQTQIWKDGDREVTVANLLARTVLYKVGHHGSHNATLRAKGLELMTDPRLIALVPVDTYVAHEKKHWDQMPFEPLTAALGTRAGKRVVFADKKLATAAGEEWGPKIGRAVDATEMIEVESKGKKLDKRPLYVDVFLPVL